MSIKIGLSKCNSLPESSYSFSGGLGGKKGGEGSGEGGGEGDGVGNLRRFYLELSPCCPLLALFVVCFCLNPLLLILQNQINLIRI